jgi:iron complex transport system ATP-binding protein
MIARTLAQDTPLIVLDEPTAFLDLPNRYEIILLLKTLAAEQHKIIIFSTHDITLALKTAQQMWVMADETFYAAAPEALLKDGTLDKVFGMAIAT